MILVARSCEKFYFTIINCLSIIDIRRGAKYKLGSLDINKNGQILGGGKICP